VRVVQVSRPHPLGRKSWTTACKVPFSKYNWKIVSTATGEWYFRGMESWAVYILRCRDGTLYTGIAADLHKRLEAHRRGVAAKYTRSRRPVTLVYQERQPDRSSALRREAALRRMGRAGKLALIAL
jgi:putative endonuclease